MSQVEDVHKEPELLTACRVEARELLKPWRNKALERAVDDWSHRGTKIYRKIPRRYSCMVVERFALCMVLQLPLIHYHGHLITYTLDAKKEKVLPNSTLLMLYELQKSCKLQTMPMERRIALCQTPICPHLRLHLHAQKSLNS